MWYETTTWTWTVIVALILGGAVHVFPKLLSKLTKLPVLNTKNVRYIQIIAGVVILLHVALMLWG